MDEGLSMAYRRQWIGRMVMDGRKMQVVGSPPAGATCIISNECIPRTADITTLGCFGCGFPREIDWQRTQRLTSNREEMKQWPHS